MIRKSALVAAVAVFLSLLLHVLGIGITAPELAEQSPDDGSSDAVELGNTFEDFAEVAPDQVEPESAEAPEPPTEDAVEPERAEVPVSEALVASPDPQQVISPDTGASSAPQAEVTEPVEPASSDADSSETAAVTPPVETEATAETPDASSTEDLEAAEASDAEALATPEPERLAALPPTEAPSVPVVPSELEAIDPEIPNTTVEPTVDEPESETSASEQAVAISKRPRLPDRRPAAEPQDTLDGFRNFDNLRNPRQTVESPLATYQRAGTDPFSGNSSQSQSDGRGAGNSTVGNYAGQVLVHLNRAPVVFVSVRGFAQVFFEISPDGSLAWVDVVDSSGSPEIERAAREQVRRAAPFPRPPEGASRRLSFYYQNG